MSGNDWFARIKSGLTDAKSNRSPWDSFFRDSLEYVVPRRRGIDWNMFPDLRSTATNVTTSGARPVSTTSQSFVPDNRADSTATISCEDAARGLMSATVSPNFPWFDLRSDNDQLNEYKPFIGWADECAKRMFSIFARSNFYTAMYESFIDDHSIGTATLYVDMDDDNEFRFIAINPLEMYIKESWCGDVETWWRVFKVRKSILKNKFKNIDPDEFGFIKNSQSDGWVNIIHFVAESECFEIDPYNYPEAIDPSVFDPSGGLKPYIGVYYVSEGKTSIAKPLCIEGYFESPYITNRFTKNTGEEYGGCPALSLMPDIKAANQLRKSIVRMAQYEADPPLQAPGMFKGTVQYQPRGVTYNTIGTTGRFERLFAPSTGASINVEVLRDYTQAIRRGFNSDSYTFLMADQRQKTAAEVYQLQQEKMDQVAPVVGRLVTEKFNPLIKRVFNLMMRSGMLPELPKRTCRCYIKTESTVSRAVVPGPATATACWSNCVWYADCIAICPDVPSHRHTP